MEILATHQRLLACQNSRCLSKRREIRSIRGLDVVLHLHNLYPFSRDQSQGFWSTSRPKKIISPQPCTTNDSMPSIQSARPPSSIIPDNDTGSQTHSNNPSSIQQITHSNPSFISVEVISKYIHHLVQPKLVPLRKIGALWHLPAGAHFRRCRETR